MAEEQQSRKRSLSASEEGAETRLNSRNGPTGQSKPKALGPSGRVGISTEEFPEEHVSIAERGLARLFTKVRF